MFGDDHDVLARERSGRDRHAVGGARRDGVDAALDGVGRLDGGIGGGGGAHLLAGPGHVIGVLEGEDHRGPGIVTSYAAALDPVADPFGGALGDRCRRGGDQCGRRRCGGLRVGAAVPELHVGREAQRGDTERAEHGYRPPPSRTRRGGAVDETREFILVPVRIGLRCRHRSRQRRTGGRLIHPRGPLAAIFLARRGRLSRPPGTVRISAVIAGSRAHLRSIHCPALHQVPVRLSASPRCGNALPPSQLSRHAPRRILPDPHMATGSPLLPWRQQAAPHRA